MDKLPIDMSNAYAGDNKSMQQAWEDGFVSGISWEIERRTKELIENNAKYSSIEIKANEAWEAAIGRFKK